MVKKLKKNKKEAEKNNKTDDKKKNRKIIFKNRLRPKINILINSIKKYRNPNEYTRQDQVQKLLKYMKLKPVEFL